MRRSRPLSICMVASEALPYAKSGGLADVVGALPKVLARLGCRVHLFHPYYRSVKERFPRLKERTAGLELALEGESLRASILGHRPCPGVYTFLVREDFSFDREGLYGDDGSDYSDNARRFTIFCRFVLAAIERFRLRPHLIHLHDWQTALIPLYIRHRRDLAPSLSNIPTLMTVHNLVYQGLFPREILATAGIPERLFHPDDIEFYGRVNFLKGGILYADAVSTVSRRYSREIQTPEYGAGLEGVLSSRSKDLFGILNGVDYTVWDPAVDPFLSANYSPENLSGKKVCKRVILQAFGLPPDTGRPLMVTVSRLIDQKGFDIIAHALPSLLDIGFNYLLLGTGGKEYQETFSEMARRYPEKMAVRIAYDESLAHRLEAGADFFLMPSRFEPCGLNQIYSLRYGTIPIVRATGGLDDTITNFNPETGRGNGLKFDEYTPEALTLKAHEAFLAYRRPEQMSKLIQNAMAEDYSWERSARLYLDLYRKLIAVKKESSRG